MLNAAANFKTKIMERKQEKYRLKLINCKTEE